MGASPTQTLLRLLGGQLGGAAGSTANPDSQYYAMVCQARCPGRHWFSTVYTNHQVICPQCHKPTTFNHLVEGDTRSGPLGTRGQGGRKAGQEEAKARNKGEAAAVEAATDGAGPSDGGAGRRAAAASLLAAAEKAAAEEDVDVEDLSQKMGTLASPSKPDAKRPKKGGGGGGSSSQAIELTHSQEE